ncbi:DUF885 domain-containing protein [Paraglaciecola sp.]|uniref:DUF885 domain-containing protein n=1 Tax=Paraglaciecola sp. TaxID=1920173 RepID=UPI003EF43389
MQKILYLLILNVFCYSCFAATSNNFDKLLTQIWQYELQTNPVQATGYGVHDFDDQLSDLSESTLVKQHQQFKQFLQQLSQIDQSTLSRNQQISLLIQSRRLQNHIDNYLFNAHYMPLTSESGFYSQLAFLPRTSPFSTAQDYSNYLARLDQFPRYFEQQINWMKKGIKKGFVQPKTVLIGVDETVQGFIHKTAQESVFFSPFKQIKQSRLNGELQTELKKRAINTINTKVFKAYQMFYEFLVNEYIPNSKDNIAASSWPDGRSYYQNRSNYYTTTQMSAEDIHQLGLSEVKRIRVEMQQVINNLKFDGDINQFIHHLRNDPKFYASSAEQLLKQASYIAKKMDAKLPLLFNNLPRSPYGVEAVPSSIAPKYTTGRYIPPKRDDQPGYYWVNTYALDKRPLYALTALTLHEAVPGHHLQISLAREMQNVPDVRRYTYISAFGEGWGLYSEYLGKEVGMYEDLYDEFGRLSYEMWRACRLVVDTGIHIKSWSKQQAIDYMLENTALSEHNVKTEIDRYISWPAQALSYKVGEMMIKRLRQKAEAELTDKFDVRKFHNAVLEYGSVTLPVLESNIQNYINSNK